MFVLWGLMPCTGVLLIFFIWRIVWVGLFVSLIFYSPSMLDVIALGIWGLYEGGPCLWILIMLVYWFSN